MQQSKILVSGTSGLIGRALVSFLRAQGHLVFSLVRAHSRMGPSAVYWDPSSDTWDKSGLEGFDAVIHLAGENIAAHRWSKKQKERLFVSRCRDTWLLTQALIRLQKKPKVLITASACGYYGDRKLELLTEKSSKGRGFLADLCERWELATSAATQQGVRVVHARFGLVLSLEGGVLAKMLPLFRLGLGGRLGTGAQLLPWVALEDAIGALYHALVVEELQGPVNICAPHPVSQAAFAKTLGRVLHRPVFLSIPAFMIRVFLGEMADELLLASTNAYPERLLQTGYLFRFSQLALFLEKNT